MKMNKTYIYLIFLAFTIAGTVSAQQPDFTGLKVMLNPGHGGHDSDDRGMVNGFWESEGNLTKGLWLRDLLEERGCEVVMSRVLNRTEDDLPLSQIAGMANDNNVDLFVSIHSNAGNQKVNYPMPIFNGHTNSPTNPLAKEFSIILWEQLISIQSTFWTHTSPKYIGDLTLNPTWNYGYGVLVPLEVPGIISEGSFHDYRPEMDRLLSIEYRKQEAWNMLFAIEEYFELPGQEPFGLISGVVRDSLLDKDDYNIANSPDKYHVVNGCKVELIETGEVFVVDSLNTGFYQFDSLAPGTYNLAFSATKYFSDTVEVTVENHKYTYHNHWLEADKTMPPSLLEISPNNNELIHCNDPIKMKFSMNMNAETMENAFTISPAIEGNFTWDDDYLTAWFQPAMPFETNTTYTVTIDTTLEHQWGVKLDTVYTAQFTTDGRNRYHVDYTFPAQNQENVSPQLQFRVIFDAPIKNTSLIGAVGIIDQNGDTLSTKGAKISEIDSKGHYYFSPDEVLEYNSSYTLQLSGTIQDHNGIPIYDTININFTTKAQNSEGMVVIDEMESTDDWKLNYGSSPGLKPESILYYWQKEKISGFASLLFRYGFNIQTGHALIKPTTPIEVAADTTIGLWIWGDLSTHMVEIGYNNQVTSTLCSIDFAGWDFKTTRVPANATTLEYIKIDQAYAGSTAGDIYLDALSQPEIISINNNQLFDAKAYPNPLQGNKLTISGLPNDDFKYSIYNITGQLLQNGTLAVGQKGESTININKQTKEHSVILMQVMNENQHFSFYIINIE